MPMSEACALWVEQAVQEAVESGSDVVRSFTEVSREIQAEIQKRFETVVSLRTLRRKVSNATVGQLGQHPETPATTPVKGGDSGDKITPQEVVQQVDAIVKKGKSVREAAKEVADEHGKRPDTIRKTYSREKERQNVVPANFAINCAHRAIDALDLIPRKDADRGKAMSMVREWIEKNT